MNRTKHRALGLASLMLLSILLSVAPAPHSLSSAVEVHRSGTISDSTFTSSMTTISGTVGSPITPTIPVHFGYSMTQGSVNLSLEGTQTSTTTTYTVASGLLNGTLNATVNDGTSVQLVSSSAGPPQAGTNSSTVLSATSMTGTHAFDTLELLCGIASCGSIVATGDLTLYVNTLRVEQGTSVLANDVATGGLGAGTSTTTATNGRNDGGGGAGHGGVGGAGGGTGGGSGGSAYGNGTERGSQGGSVSSSYHSAANGGGGGGYLRIFADQVIVNGTIQANGGNGDSGSQASSGTGAGGSGAGGGSGGSVFIQANSLSLSSTGILSANGGTGGNGANGAQNGPGFGMYDGGDGGGGGAGGRIVIKTQTGGYTNGGTVSAAGGSGGSLGYKYGTGVDGNSGSAGAAGTIATSTWGGYISTGNTTANNGSFTTHPIHTQSGEISPAYVRHTTTIPATGSLTATYRYTVNGSDASFNEWSAWAPLSLSGEWIPAHRWLQIDYNFSRTGSTSPSLSAVSLETSTWTTLTSTAFTYDGQATLPGLGGLTVGRTTTVNNTGTSAQAQFSIDVPSGAEFSDDLTVWMQWDEVQAGSAASLTGIELGGTSVWSETVERTAEGYMLTLDRANLTAQSPSSTWTDGHGLLWSTYDLAVDFSQPTNVWYDHLSLPWSLSVPVNLTGSVNDAILGDCGTFYTFTAGSCFGQSTLHRLSLTGITQPVGSPAFTFEINDPSFAWTDTYAPELSSVQHRQGIVQLPDLRVNESFSIVLFDVAGEDDLTVEFLGLDWEEADGFTGAQTMFHHNGLNGYYIYLNTEGLDVNAEHQLNMTFRLLDAAGNELLPRPTYQVEVYPVQPDIASFALTGPTVISTTGTTSTWGVDDADITLSVGERHHRSNLDVVAQLTPNGNGQALDLPMTWDETNMTYMAQWQPARSDMGEWEIEVLMSETDGLMASVENGWQAGPDAIVHLVDTEGPTITEASYPTLIEPNETLTVSLAWTGATGETYQGNIAVLNDGVEVANKTILSTQATNATLVFSTEGWTPGIYEIHWWIHDDAGNTATDASGHDGLFELLVPLITANLSMTQSGTTTLSLTGDVTTRSGTSTLTLSHESGAWTYAENLTNGPFERSVEVEGFVVPVFNSTLTVCDGVDVDACESINMQLDVSDAFALNTPHQCTTTQAVSRSTEDQRLLSCSVENAGRADVSVRFLIDGGAPAGLLVDDPLVLPSGANGIVNITLPATTLDIDQNVVWSLVVEDAFNASLILETSTFTVERTSSEPSTEGGDDVEVAGESSGVMTAVVGVLLAVVLGGLAIYRIARREDDSPLDLTEAVADAEDAKAVVELPEDDGLAMDAPEASAPHAGPTRDTAATSVDEHGYEWYSTDNGHWYRTQGSQDEWQPYQP
ncbi:MAG: hypothetical protein ACPHVR_04370 [Poseidonia sp.]